MHSRYDATTIREVGVDGCGDGGNRGSPDALLVVRSERPGRSRFALAVHHHASDTTTLCDSLFTFILPELLPLSLTMNCLSGLAPFR
jgi:hypothetical protein